MNKMPVFNFDYKTKTQTLYFGPTQILIESIENIDQAIDAMFTYFAEIGEPELLEEYCPYFGVVWPAALGLTTYLSKLPHGPLKTKKILEIGCGLALPSLYLALQGTLVTSADLHPEVPRFLSSNMLHNKISPASLNLVVQNWKNDLIAGAPFDLIIGSDLLYENHHPNSLSQALSNHLTKNGELIIADPGRPYLQDFATQMTLLGFDVQTQSQDEIFILHMKRGLSKTK